MLASAGKFMALYTFRDSSRLQLLVFNVYGWRALLTRRLRLFPGRSWRWEVTRLAEPTDPWSPRATGWLMVPSWCVVKSRRLTQPGRRWILRVCVPRVFFVTPCPLPALLPSTVRRGHAPRGLREGKRGPTREAFVPR